METTDLTPILLRNLRGDIARFDAKLEKVESSLRDEVRALQADCATREELHDAVAGLHERIDRVHARLVENDVRAVTSHHELQITLTRIGDYLDAHGGLEARVGVCERDIADLRHRVV